MRKTITWAVLALLIWLPLFTIANAEAEIGRDATIRSESSTITGLSVKNYPAKTIYDAFDTLDKKGLILLASYEDGSTREISGDSVSVSYQKDTCLRVGDSHIFLSYAGLTVSVPVTVNRIEYELAALEIADFSVTYNGKYNSFKSPIPDIVGKDGIPLIIKVKGGGSNVGKYDISIDFETTSADYYTPDTRVVTMTVEPYEAEIVWDNLSFVYDGKSKIPSAHFLDVFGNKIYPAAIGAATNAGTDYSAKVVFNDPNYVLVGTETKYEIKKADYNFKDIKWSTDSFVYDGSSKSISLSGLPSGVKVTSYVGDKATDAGTYTVTAKLSWEEANYNAPTALTHTWEITPAKYDVSAFEFLPGEYVFDGKKHYPELRGKMPVGRDGIALEYSFSEGACHVSDGTVSSVITFSTKSKNYIPPEPIYSSVTVKPLGIEVSWGNNEFYYSGSVLMPRATSSECVVKVSGGEVNVGKYTAEAYTENTDFYIINSFCDYTVKKSENRWLCVPENTICYEGKTPTLPVKVQFGEVQLIYYSDADGLTVIAAPTSAGNYYAKAVVSGTENYTGIESAIFSFEIVKIVPISFIATLKIEGFKAYETLTADAVDCIVVNNDGSQASVDFDLVTVAYQNGDSFRRADSSVILKYGKFNYKIPISVDLADYDLGSVKWTNTDLEYDGCAKTPTLIGLPSGVSVKEYIGGGAVYVGEYTVYAILDYDEENYNQPSVGGCTLKIRKKAVELPTLTAVYNGTLQIPKSNSSLYEVTSQDGFKDAGKYVAQIELFDSQNYEFYGGGDKADAYFVITPRVIGVAIGEIKLHLFEKVGNVDYTISSGEFADGDFPRLSSYVVEKNVFLRSDDPNYTVVSTGGAIKRLPYPSGAFMLYFLLVVTILSLIGAAVYFGLIKRHILENAVAVIKCRWHNRNLLVYPPRVIKRKKGAREVKTEETGEKIEDTPQMEETHQQENESPEEREAEKATEETEEVEETEEAVKLDGEFAMDAEHADELITDSLAKELIKKEGNIVYTDGNKKNIVNVDTLSENFTSGDRVDVNSMKSKSLVPDDTGYVKVLARGMINKPLRVYANDFSLSAVKMIALTGGEARKAVTMKPKNDKKTNTDS